MNEIPRLRLRAVERADIPHLVAWFNDPAVTPGIGYILPLSAAREERWFDEMLMKPGEEHGLVIEAAIGDNWQPVGITNLFNLNWHARSAELGIVIGDTRFWGKGYGTLAVRAMQRYAFDTLNLNRLYLRVFADNLPAIHLYEKVGFVREGIQRQSEFKNGSYKDDIMMSILRSEWNPSAS